MFAPMWEVQGGFDRSRPTIMLSWARLAAKLSLFYLGTSQDPATYRHRVRGKRIGVTNSWGDRVYF